MACRWGGHEVNRHGVSELIRPGSVPGRSVSATDHEQRLTSSETIGQSGSWTAMKRPRPALPNLGKPSKDKGLLQRPLPRQAEKISAQLQRALRRAQPFPGGD